MAAVVEARRRGDPRPDDRFRGLYIDDIEADRILGARSGRPDAAGRPADGIPIPDAGAGDPSARPQARWDRFVRAFGLTPLERDLFLVALAPDLDPRFERLYGYLNDDVSRRRASVGLALTLSGAGLVDGAARHCLSPTATLVAERLVTVEDADRPVLTRGLRVPDRIVAHLLGQDEPDPLLTHLVRTPARWMAELDQVMVAALTSGVGLTYVQDREHGPAPAWLAASLAAAGRAVFTVDLSATDTGDDHARLAALARREGRLLDAVLLAVGVEHLADGPGRDPAPGLVRQWADDSEVILVGTGVWDPRWSRRTPLLLEPPVLTPSHQARMWTNALGLADTEEPPAAIQAYRLGPEQIASAAEAARHRAVSEGRSVGDDDLRRGARAQNSAGLEKLARRITPKASWDDLVVPPTIEAQLHALVGRVRHRARVLDEWQLAPAASKGRGITVLFTGESGTGKTMSAEVMAHALGLELYVIDLSTVVDKYIGETEKNLDRIFDEAERVNGVLLFDEADAIFGKRSEVKDARDRYANVEVAYLLQRMEQFDGIAVLTTNLRANVDDAFLRRLDVLVEFPVPTASERERLWRAMLRPELPAEDDVDVAFLAKQFELSGGNIHNVVVGAAYEAATAGNSVAMAHLVRATAAEYRKLGRLCVASEFGRWYPALTEVGTT